MPSFNNYSADGRTIMVKFTCSRCGAEHIDPLELHRNDDDQSYGYLHRIKPPNGWKDLLHGPLLCANCYQKYLKFMEGKI